MGTITKFAIEELASLDGGRIKAAFDQAIKRAAEDCEDRPADDRVRKVVLQMEFVPVVDERGICESVTTSIQIKDTVPTRKSRKYDFGLRRGGMLVFQPDALDNHRQQTFTDDDNVS